MVRLGVLTYFTMNFHRALLLITHNVQLKEKRFLTDMIRLTSSAKFAMESGMAMAGTFMG